MRAAASCCPGCASTQRALPGFGHLFTEDRETKRNPSWSNSRHPQEKHQEMAKMNRRESKQGAEPQRWRIHHKYLFECPTGSEELFGGKLTDGDTRKERELLSAPAWLQENQRRVLSYCEGLWQNLRLVMSPWQLHSWI